VGNRARFGLIVLVFFVSGISGLSLQVVWLRQLALVFGATAQATAVLLAAFMGGLALGGWLGGRLAERSGIRPLTLYGLFEIGIGVAAVLVPKGFVLADAVLGVLDDRQMFPLAGRIVLALVLILPPTILMGATLPLVSRWATLGGRALSSGAGLLYAANTAGALTGTLLCAAVFLPRYGVTNTSWLVMLIAVTAGLAAIALSKERVTDDAARDRREATRRLPPLPLLALAAVTGLSGLALEVVGTRVLCLFVGTTVFAFAAVVATFLLGIALGSFLVVPLLRLAPATCLRLVGVLQIATALVLVAAIASIDRIPRLYLELYADRAAAGVHPLLLGLAVSSALLLVPAALGGACFPLLIRASGHGAAGGGRVVGWFYAANTFGAVLGAMLAGFVFVPQLGLQGSLELIAIGFCALIAAPLALLAPAGARGTPMVPRRGFARPAAVVLLVLAPILATRFVTPWDPLLLSAGVYWQSEAYLAADPRGGVREILDTALAERTSLFHSEGLGATVDVYERSDGLRSLAINGKTVASSAFEDIRLQVAMGGLATLLHEDPREVLVIGLGTGMTAGAAIAHPGVERLTIVELTPGIARAARLFDRWHGAVLDDPRTELRIDDGAIFVRHTSRTFDVISSDPIHPFSAGSSTLYSREHFEQCRSRLRPGGLFFQWLPLYQLGPRDLGTVLRTMAAVFPDVTVWFTGTDAVLLGSETPVTLDGKRLERLRAVLRTDSVRERFAPAGFETAEQLLVTLVGPVGAFTHLVEESPLNTIDYPVLEFSAPLAIARHRLADELLAVSRSGSALLDAHLDLPALERARRAFGHFVASLSAGNAQRRREHARAAWRTAPDDRLYAWLYGRLVADSRAPLSHEEQALLTALVAEPPDDPLGVRARIRLARERLRLQDFDGALALLDAHEVSDTGRCRIVAQRMRVLVDARRDEALRAMLTEDGSGDRPPRCQSLLRTRFLAVAVLGQRDEAAALSQRLATIELPPSNHLALLARTLLDRGDVDAALDAARRAVTYRPEGAHDRALLARIELAAGRPRDALATVRDAVEKRLALPETLLHSARAYWMLGRADSARAALSRYLRGRGLSTNDLEAALVLAREMNLPQLVTLAESRLRRASGAGR